ESVLARIEAELAHTRGALDQRVQASANEVVQALAAQRAASSPDEAIFRLAASLDQVGMKIEQRLKTQYTALQDHLEDVGAAILSARNHMQGLTRGGEDHIARLRDEVHAQVESALEQTGHWSTSRRDRDTPSLGVLDSIDEPAPVAEVEDVDSALPVNP